MEAEIAVERLADGRVDNMLVAGSIVKRTELLSIKNEVVMRRGGSDITLPPFIHTHSKHKPSVDHRVDRKISDSFAAVQLGMTNAQLILLMEVFRRQ